MAAPSKTASTSVIAWTDLASAAQSIGSAIDVRTIFAVALRILLGRANGTILTVGTKVRVEASTASSGAPWVPIFQYQMAIGVATIGNTTLNGAVSAGAGTVTLTSATNFAVGDLIFLGDASTANYELARIKSISTNTLTLEENTIFSHSNGAVVTNQAEMVFPTIDVRSYAYLRVIADGVGVGQGTKVAVDMTTFNSVA